MRHATAREQHGLMVISRPESKLGRRSPMNALIAVGSLVALVALLVAPGGVLLAPFVFGVFLLALTGVLGGLQDHTVRQHNPKMDPRGWRDG
jgi:hypothetical protein